MAENIEESLDKKTIVPSSNSIGNIRVTDILRNAYDEKNFVLLDEIIEDMVKKSYVDGLKKLHTASGYGISELVEQYLVKDKIDPNSMISFIVFSDL